MVHGLALFSHSAEMEGEGRVGGNRTCASGVVARPRSRQACRMACAPVHWKRGTRKMGCMGSVYGIASARLVLSHHCLRGPSGPSGPVEPVEHSGPQVCRRSRDILWAIRSECRGGRRAGSGSRAPLVGRLALPRVVCVRVCACCVCAWGDVALSHFGRSVR